jgi:hypothetical protein
MKTAELTTTTVYAFQEDPYGSTYPVKVLEKSSWTEKNSWFDKEEGEGREERRILRRAEKGERAGTKSPWYGNGYRKTGIPVLKLGLTDWQFENYSYAETAEELLAQAAEKLSDKIMDLVDSKESVFTTSPEGKNSRKTQATVTAHFTEGGSEEITVHLELVRPQQLIGSWAGHMEGKQKKALAMAEFQKKAAEKKAVSDEVARSIASRLDGLLGASESKTSEGERYDAHREDAYHGGTTYHIDQATLLKLLELAEKGADK